VKYNYFFLYSLPKEKYMISETLNIKITKAEKSKINEVDFDNLPFGKIFCDHMLVMDYAEGKWQTPEIKPFQNIQLHPATSALHYGQSIFEGIKAYRTVAGEIAIFRPDMNAERMRKSCIRMCMPEISDEMFMHMITELVKIDQHWLPNRDDVSLYIRPFMYADDEYIGIKPSDSYRFIIFCCPVGKYYAEPLKVKIEEFYTRSSIGGVGQAKTAGNYSASLYPASLAKKEGYHQLVWTDGFEHKYIEESGTMNIVFVIDDVIITPEEETDTILKGITKRSVLTLAKEWGYKVEERKVSVAEVITAIKENRLQDAFGAGTAATIAPIDIIGHQGVDYKLPAIEARAFSNRAYKVLNEIKKGKVADKYNWLHRI
jgi:branched-chain amino acid aminotransferase